MSSVAQIACQNFTKVLVDVITNQNFQEDIVHLNHRRGSECAAFGSSQTGRRPGAERRSLSTRLLCRHPTPLQRPSWCLRVARRAKQRTYPALFGAGRLVVGLKVNGRWSQEAAFPPAPAEALSFPSRAEGSLKRLVVAAAHAARREKISVPGHRFIDLPWTCDRNKAAAQPEGGKELPKLRGPFASGGDKHITDLKTVNE